MFVTTLGFCGSGGVADSECSVDYYFFTSSREVAVSVMPFVFFPPEKINKKWGSFLRGPAVVRRTKRHCRTRHFQQRTRIPQRAYKKERREALWKPRPTMLSSSIWWWRIWWDENQHDGLTGLWKKGVWVLQGPSPHSKGHPNGKEGSYSPLIASPNWTNWNLPFFFLYSVQTRQGGMAARHGCGKGFIHFCIFVIREKRNFYGYFYGSSVPIAVMLILFSSCPWCIWIVAWGDVMQPFPVRLKAEKWRDLLLQTFFRLCVRLVLLNVCILSPHEPAVSGKYCAGTRVFSLLN